MLHAMIDHEPMIFTSIYVNVQVYEIDIYEFVNLPAADCWQPVCPSWRRPWRVSWAGEV